LRLNGARSDADPVRRPRRRPPELEWLANITNAKTRRAYKDDVREFSAFTGLRQPAELRTVTRAHMIAWRSTLSHASSLRPASDTSSRRCLRCSIISARATQSPAIRSTASNGPMANVNEGSTPALGDAHARKLLEAPPGGHAQGRARSRYPRRPALSWHPLRGTVRLAGQGHAAP
jgi:integrase/recombinase XerD